MLILKHQSAAILVLCADFLQGLLFQLVVHHQIIIFLVNRFSFDAVSTMKPKIDGICAYVKFIMDHLLNDVCNITSHYSI